MMNRILFTILICFLFMVGKSQSNEIVLKPSLEGNIEIKWYSSALTYDNGVDVFRQSEGKEWTKLNDKSIIRGNPNFIFESESNETEALVSALQKDWHPKGIMLLNCLVKSFQENEFAEFIGIYYVDKTAQKGESYRYKVVSNSKEIAISDWLTNSPTQITPPREINVKQTKREVSIYWLPEEKRYFGVNVYRQDTNQEFKKVNNYPVMVTKSPDENKDYPDRFYIDKTIKPGTTYSYKLTSIDFFGYESDYSETFNINIKDTIPPLRPYQLTKEDVKLQDVYLSWKNPDYQKASGINVYRSKRFDGPFKKVNQQVLSVQDTAFVDHTDEAGDFYYYIATIDQFGNEGATNKVIIHVEDMIAPEVPQGVTAYSDTGKIILSWNRNQEKDLKGYLIYRTINEDQSEKYTLLNSTPVTDTFFVDILPKRARNNFAYKIVASDTSFNNSDYSAPAILRQPDVTPPETPVIKSAQIAENGIKINWIENREKDLKDYQVFRKEKSEEDYSFIASIPKEKSEFLDTNLNSQKLYCYYLVATDSVNNVSNPSNSFEISSPVLSQEYLPLNLKWKYKKRKQSLNLDWSNNKIDNVLGYVLLVDEGSGFKQESGMLQASKYQLDLSKNNKVKVTCFLKDGTKINSEVIEL